MNDNDCIFDDTYIPPPPPAWKAKSNFDFSKGDNIKFSDTVFYIYEETPDYVTINIRKKYATAKLMQFMETLYDAVYIGPMIEWTDGAHLTFKRKS